MERTKYTVSCLFPNEKIRDIVMDIAKKLSEKDKSLKRAGGNKIESDSKTATRETKQ